MDQKEFDALMEKFKGANEETLNGLKADIKNLQEGSITMDTFKESIEGFAKSEDIAGLKENIEKIAVDMKKLRDAGPQERQTIKGLLLGEDVKTALDRMAKTGSKDLHTSFDIKTNVLRSSVTDHTLAMRLDDVGQQAYQSTVISGLFRQAGVSANNNGTIRYVDQATITRNAATRAEAATYPESAIAWQEYSLPIEKLTDSIPVSYEMLNDVDFVESEIRRLLEVNMAILEDNQVYDGNGTTPNLKGVYTSATAFTDLTPKIQDANIYDLINVVATKIGNGKESKYMANKVLMNPADVLTMISEKDANNNYLQPPFVSKNGNIMVNGVEVISTPTVDANTMLVGDFNWGTYYTSDNFEIEIGWVSTQFLQDMFTMKARKRAALLVRTVDATAFYKVANITTAITNITA